MLNFKVIGQTLKRLDGSRVVAYSENYLTASFDLPENYKGTISAHFKIKIDGEEYGEPILVENNECYVPNGVIKPAGFYICLTSLENDTLITTSELFVPVYQGGSDSGTLPNLPDKTPNQYALFEAMYNELVALSEQGLDGKSAYEVATSQGFTGTVEQWLESLVGPQGEEGIQGIPGEKGETGKDGQNGLSAYEIAVKLGYTGSESLWIESLKGEQGVEGQKGEDGVNGSNGINGSDGKSAYELAVSLGYSGTLSSWIASLRGEKGDQGIQGVAGTNGANGITPAKGVDYFTAAEVASIVADAKTQAVNELYQFSTITENTNVFAIDMGNKNIKNVSIEVTNTTAKSLTISNIPAGRVELCIDVKFTALAAISYFPNVLATSFQNGIAPTFVSGKRYNLLFVTNNQGTTWQATAAGGWST